MVSLMYDKLDQNQFAYQSGIGVNKAEMFILNHEIMSTGQACDLRALMCVLYLLPFAAYLVYWKEWIIFVCIVSYFVSLSYLRVKALNSIVFPEFIIIIFF